MADHGDVLQCPPIRYTTMTTATRAVRYVTYLLKTRGRKIFSREKTTHRLEEPELARELMCSALNWIKRRLIHAFIVRSLFPITHAVRSRCTAGLYIYVIWRRPSLKQLHALLTFHTLLIFYVSKAVLYMQYLHPAALKGNLTTCKRF